MTKHTETCDIIANDYGIMSDKHYCQWSNIEHILKYLDYLGHFWEADGPNTDSDTDSLRWQ